MSERKRVLVLILIMATASLIVASITISMLYRAAFEEERARLVETAQSQARLIESIARFDAIYSRDYQGGPEEATLSKILDAHREYKGFGETGEFTLARRVGNDIVFLLSHRHYDLNDPRPVPFDTELAEPMRHALSGLSGTVVGLDYRGELVLAAHEPVAELNLGLVAKIDLAEVRAPFVKSSAVALVFVVLVVVAGMALPLRISSPIIRRLEEMVGALRESEVSYRDLYENAPNAYFSISAVDGSIRRCNSAALQLLGYEREDLEGMMDLIEKDDIVVEFKTSARTMDS